MDCESWYPSVGEQNDGKGKSEDVPYIDLAVASRSFLSTVSFAPKPWDLFPSLRGRCLPTCIGKRESFARERKADEDVYEDVGTLEWGREELGSWGTRVRAKTVVGELISVHRD